MKEKIDEKRKTLYAFLEASNTMTRKSDVVFEEYEISPAQFNILNLAGLNGGAICQRELVENLLVGKATVSILLNRMLRERLITRKADKKDLRRSIIRLTAKGKKIWEVAAVKYEEAIQGVFGVFEEKDLAKFQELLRQLDYSLQTNIEE